MAQAGYPASYALSARQTQAPSHSPAPGLPQFGGAPPLANAPPGTLAPGTIVRVGEFEVRVERYLTEGGFAHVYLANSATPIPAGSPSASTKHVLKRIAVPDKKGVEEVGKEVEVMKLVRNHPRIVNMIEASVSELPGGVNGSKGYEIYILMEWCAGGGIIDMMNTRLQNRLTETEILKIFSDTVEAVAHMHYQSPPLIHRDLKVENILLSPPQTYKLCDFGSTTTPMPREKVPTAVEAIQKMELEINKTTTLQYRAPELVDVWGRKGYDEKIDIWALGVLLYKLCYYTTPFEEHGPLAILNAQYKIPPYPAYSNSIKGLIGAMLQESAPQRPNIYQVHEHVCRLRGVAVRLENKYASSSSPAPSVPSKSAAYSNILSSGPVPSGPAAPSLAETISPMRRGRPTKGSLAPPAAATAAVEPDTRMVKTGGEAPIAGREWEPMGSTASGSGSAWPTGKSAPSTGSNGFGDAFSVGPSSAGTASSPAVASFGDSFAPSAASPPTTSFSPSSNGAMFADLVPPSATSSPKPGPMVPKQAVSSNAGGLSSFGNEGWTSRSSSAAAIPQATSPAPPPAKAGQLDDEKAAFESTYPSLDDFPAPSFTPSHIPTDKPAPSATSAVTGASSKSFGTAFVPSPSPVPAQLTGDAGPPLPRRPVGETTSLPLLPSPLPLRAPSKPELVSRSSQTSPHLLAGWRPPIGTSTRLNKSEVHDTMRSPEPVALPGLATGLSNKAKSFDLLGDDVDNDDEFAPKPLNTSSSASSTLPSSTLPPLTQPTASTLPPLTQTVPASSTGNVASKRMSFIGGSFGGQSFDSTSSASTREKFRPVKPIEGAPQAKSPAPIPAPQAPSSTAATSGNDEDAEKRYPSIDLLDTTPPAPSPKVSTPEPQRTGSKDESWQPIVEKEDADESSDDEPEDFAPRPVGNSNGREARPLPQPPTSTSTGLQPAATITSNSSTLPPISRLDSMSSSEGGGDIDLGPALSSIRKFAPVAEQPPQQQQQQQQQQPKDDWSPPSVSRPTFSPNRSPTTSRGPPLLAPKPQSSKRQAAITNLVSRYETLSTTTSPTSESAPHALGPNTTGSSSSSKRAPPPPAAKPTGLRRGDSLSSNTSDCQAASNRPHWASKAASPHHFQQRFPDAEGLDKHLTGEMPSTPPSAGASSGSFGAGAGAGAARGGGGDRQPFKPVGPPGTPKRDSFLPSQPNLTSTSSGGRPLPKVPSAAEQEEQEEEKFAGVSNMKSRWESMGKGGQQSSGPGNAKGARKEWGVV
ncbi:hypothetical protein BCR35DRAFT_296112 [Leucosporidium creatinivorum]|uniref:non-specific serine/threonine protein kinase n=1 Tax=Leucosporidium creatinivorum TaxID=106004 RepID=A0A1Y2DCW0_9BASI|nr:hypothetical protein BCR35DRAFT_296112 [Leucosporidium creatinivorum]